MTAEIRRLSAIPDLGYGEMRLEMYRRRLPTRTLCNGRRHPYYSTTSIVMLSVTILTANWLVGFGCVLVLTCLALRTPKEEQKLVDKFGSDYLNYKSITGMFFPTILNLRKR